VRNRSRLTILLFSIALPFACAQMPEAPQPHVPLTDKILLGTIAAGRAGDALTTHQFLVAGQDEGTLPIWLACRQPNMWTYSMLATAGQIQLSRLLIGRRHHRIARSIEVVHAAFIWNIVAHNEAIIPAVQTRRRLRIQPNSCLTTGGSGF
jgi:hypothetical protein